MTPNYSFDVYYREISDIYFSYYMIMMFLQILRFGWLGHHQQWMPSFGILRFANREYSFPACGQGHYKDIDANVECTACPANSVSHTPGATFCSCKEGFFRVKGDSMDQGCIGMYRSIVIPRNGAKSNRSVYQRHCDTAYTVSSMLFPCRL